MAGKEISELDSLVEQDGTELFVLVSDPTVTPINKRVAGDYLPLRGQPMWTVLGTLSVDTDAAPWFICSVPGGLQLLNTALAVKTAATGADIIVDIEVSTDGANTWTSIYSARPTLPAGDKYIEEAGTLSITHIDQGDLLRPAVDQVGSSVAGANLTISLWTRQGGTGVQAATTSTSTTTLTSSSTSTTTVLSMSWQSPSSIYLPCGQELTGLAHSLIDGDTSTYWLHAYDHLHDIVVNLGETKHIEKIRLYVYPAMNSSQWQSFDVYISDDPDSWGAPAHTWGNFLYAGAFPTWIEQALSSPKSGQYLRLVLINTADANNTVMGAEFEVYAS